MLEGSGKWVGWVLFAAIMLTVTGTINIVQGIVALFRQDWVVMIKENLYVVNMQGVGWALVILGSLMVATGFGLLAAQTWARVAAIGITALHAISQIVWFGAYPVWSILMIALDTVILFALTARWSEARDESSTSSSMYTRVG